MSLIKLAELPLKLSFINVRILELLFCFRGSLNVLIYKNTEYL